MKQIFNFTTDNVLIFMMFILFGFSSCTTKKKPNILFIMSDDHAYQAISAYGSGLNQTPNIDKIGEQGIVYNRAYVTNSICAPSRAVILTGKYSHLNGVLGNGEVFDGSQQTLSKILQQNGYQTAIVGKWHLKSDPVGFDYWNVLPGQGNYYNPDFIKNGKDTVYKGYVTEIITDLSLNWLKNRQKDKPFFLMMHHKAPHRNWMPAIKNLQLYNEKVFQFPKNFYDNYEGRQALQRQLLTVRNHMDIRMDFKVPCWSCDTVPVNSWAPQEFNREMERLMPDERRLWDEAYMKEESEFNLVKDDPEKFDQWKFQRYMEDYLRCIASVDEGVGNILSYLKENGLDRNTLVIYTSDQGFYLGEHGLFDKRFMYEEAFRTPLLMKFPKIIQVGMKTEKMVLNLDIAPTILQAAGISVPDDVQGLPLQKTWNDENTEWRDAIYYHYYEKGFGATPHYGIRTDHYKLIHYYDIIDSWELYDLQEDPTEMKNLYNENGFESITNDLKQHLEKLRKQYRENEFESD